MIYEPKKYQVEAIKLMIKQACAGLLLDPGLGKTSIGLSAFKILKAKGYLKGVLIIAPLRVCYNVWPGEIQKWDNFRELKYAVLHGPQKEAALNSKADIYLINPEGLDWLFNANRWKTFKDRVDVLFVDESTKFKHTRTARFKTLKNFLKHFKRRYIATGTPVPNGLMDLFGQVYLLDEGAALGRFITHYRTKYFYPTGYGGYTWVPQTDALQRITEIVSPLVLRMSAEDYLELPTLFNNTISVELTEEARSVYSQIEDEFYTEIGGTEVTALNAAAAGVKCRQVANGALYGEQIPHRPEREVIPLHDGKLEALEDLVEELNGNPLLVLYEFIHDRERIRAHLGKDIPAVGEMTPKKERELLAAFNNGEVPILMGHPASMGHGLNLQGACHNVCCFGITWDLELYDQSIRRVWRQGQSKPTFVHHLVAKDTLDERVMKVLGSKSRTQKSVFKALKDARK